MDSLRINSQGGHFALLYFNYIPCTVIRIRIRSEIPMYGHDYTEYSGTLYFRIYGPSPPYL